MRLPLSIAVEFTTRRHYELHQEVARATVAALRAAGYVGAGEWSLRHVDLPEPVVIRCLNMEGPSPKLVEAPEASLRRCQCSLEAGVSGAWCAALPLARSRRAIHRQIMALPHLVRSSREWRRAALRRWNASAEGKEG